jgi:tetratricopeptide (TPR) repeat protein
MKKKPFIMILLCGVLAGSLAAQADRSVFEKAKLLIFDKQWAAALAQLDEVIAKHPESPHYAAALFYRGKCQEELGARKKAVESYELFIRNSSGSNLAEEARISILDQAAALYQAGDKDYLRKILAMLNDRNKVVAYYAAFKLSYLPERKAASQALPVLLAILDKEKDDELRDRARIAVMRLDPARLKGAADPGKGSGGKMLRIRVLEGKNRQATVALNIPLALADLAIQSLSAEQKRGLQKKGYDLDQVLSRLIGQGLKIELQDEDGVFQIWVE